MASLRFAAVMVAVAALASQALGDPSPSPTVVGGQDCPNGGQNCATVQCDPPLVFCLQSRACVNPAGSANGSANCPPPATSGNPTRTVAPTAPPTPMPTTGGNDFSCPQDQVFCLQAVACVPREQKNCATVQPTPTPVPTVAPTASNKPTQSASATATAFQSCLPTETFCLALGRCAVNCGGGQTTCGAGNWTCGSACIPLTNSCNGNCAQNRTYCPGTGRCQGFGENCPVLCTDPTTWACNNTCIPRSARCGSVCAANMTFCQFTQRCQGPGERCAITCTDPTTWACNNECIPLSSRCGGNCTANLVFCPSQSRCQGAAEFCPVVCDDPAMWVCNNTCISRTTRCQGRCPDGSTYCFSSKQCVGKGGVCNDPICKDGEKLCEDATCSIACGYNTTCGQGSYFCVASLGCMSTSQACNKQCTAGFTPCSTTPVPCIVAGAFCPPVCTGGSSYCDVLRACIPPSIPCLPPCPEGSYRCPVTGTCLPNNSPCTLHNPVFPRDATFQLPSIAEDTVGAPVSLGALLGKSIKSRDGVVGGIAIAYMQFNQMVREVRGPRFEFSVDNGTTWSDTGDVDATNALLLRARPETLLRVRPSKDFFGSGGIRVYGWDGGRYNETQRVNIGSSFDYIDQYSVPILVTVTNVPDVPTLAQSTLNLPAIYKGIISSENPGQRLSSMKLAIASVDEPLDTPFFLTLLEAVQSRLGLDLTTQEGMGRLRNIAPEVFAPLLQSIDPTIKLNGPSDQQDAVNVFLYSLDNFPRLAVTATNGNGAWQASINNAWVTLNASVTPIIPVWATVRFSPAANYFGEASLIFRAVLGSAAKVDDTTASAGSAAISVIITNVNSRPTLKDSARFTMTPIEFNVTARPPTGDDVSKIASAIATDADNDLLSLAVSKVSPRADDPNAYGLWQYQEASTAPWKNFPGSISSVNVFVLGRTARIRFLPQAASFAAGFITVTPWDGVSTRPANMLRPLTPADNDPSSEFGSTYLTISSVRLFCDDSTTSQKLLDACGVCGGDGTSCAGCDGVPGSNKRLDVCNVCGGNGKSCLGCDGVPNSGARFDECGDCNGNNRAKDCAGVCRGQAAVDDCGVCTGGTTRLRPNYLKDCNGTCNGKAQIDLCGDCSLPAKYNSRMDCAGECGGSAVRDDCGFCYKAGTPRWWVDCKGTCNGKARVDRCGICDGNGRTIDACGVCNGTNSTCADCNGVPFGPARRDNCGVCNGDGTSCVIITAVNPKAAVAGLVSKVRVAGATGNATATSQIFCTWVSGSSPTTVAGTFVTKGSIDCPIPETLTTGSYTLAVTISGQVTNTVDFAVLGAVLVTSVSPTEGTLPGPFVLTVKGTGFVDNGANTKCVFIGDSGQRFAVRATVLNATTITCSLDYSFSARIGVYVVFDGDVTAVQPKDTAPRFVIYAPAPVPQAAVFASNGAGFTVSFDRDMAISPGLACDGYFASSDVSKFGSGALCFWTSSTNLAVSLRKATIAPLDTVTVTGGRLAPAGERYYRTSSTPLSLSPPDSPTPVRIFALVPEQVGSCDSSVKIQFACTDGCGGRDLTWSWTVTATPSTDTSALVTALNAAGNSGVATLSNLAAGTSYRIIVKAKNFLGTWSDSNSYNLLKSADALPNVLIAGGRSRDVPSRATPFALFGLGTAPCGPTAGMTFAWSFSDASVVLNASMLARPVLLIPPYTLAAGSSYVATLTVTINGLSASASQTLNVASNSLFARITAQSTAAADRDFVLNGDCVDPDASDAEAASSPCSFSWRCTDAAGAVCGNPDLGTVLFSTNASVRAANPSLQNVRITKGYLAPGTYNFKLTVAKGSRQDTTTAAVVVVAGNPPSVVFDSLGDNNKVFVDRRVRLSGYAITGGVAARLQWSNIAGSGFATVDLTNSSNVCTLGGSLTGAGLCIEANTLLPNSKYRFRLQATAAGATGYSDIDILVNGGPTFVELSANKYTGVAGDSFDFTAKFDDEDTPLTFAWGYLTTSATGVVRLVSLKEPLPSNTATLSLPVGSQSRGFNLTVVCTAYDRYGAASTGTVVVTVRPPQALQNGDAAAIVALARAKITGSTEVATGDYAGYLGTLVIATDLTNRALNLSSTCYADAQALLVTIVTEFDKVFNNLVLNDANIKRETTFVNQLTMAGGCVPASVASKAADYLTKLVNAALTSQYSTGTVDQDVAGFALNTLSQSSSNNSSSKVDTVSNLGGALVGNLGVGEAPTSVSSDDGSITVSAQVQQYSTTSNDTSLDFGTGCTGADCPGASVPTSAMGSLVNTSSCDPVTGKGCSVNVAGVYSSYDTDPYGSSDKFDSSLADFSLKNPDTKTDYDVANVTDGIDIEIEYTPAADGSEPVCKFYNETLGGWDTRGVRLVGRTNHSIICRTHHLSTYGGASSQTSPTNNNSTAPTNRVFAVLRGTNVRAATLLALNSALMAEFQAGIAAALGGGVTSAAVVVTSAVDQADGSVVVGFYIAGANAAASQAATSAAESKLYLNRPTFTSFTYFGTTWYTSSGSSTNTVAIAVPVAVGGALLIVIIVAVIMIQSKKKTAKVVPDKEQGHAAPAPAAAAQPSS